MPAREFGREKCGTASASARSGSTVSSSGHVASERARCMRASTLCTSKHVVLEQQVRYQAKNQKSMPFPFKSLLHNILVSGQPRPQAPPGTAFPAEALQWLGCEPPGPGACANRPGGGYSKSSSQIDEYFGLGFSSGVCKHCCRFTKHCNYDLKMITKTVIIIPTKLYRHPKP